MTVWSNVVQEKHIYENNEKCTPIYGLARGYLEESRLNST